jgi:WD40 repeat protein
VLPAGDGSDAVKIFGQPDRLELAAAAAASPNSPSGIQDDAASSSTEAAANGLDPSHDQQLPSEQQQQQVEAPPSLPGAPWEQLCSVAAAHSADVNCVKWHPTDPTLLASAGDDGVIKLWRLHTPNAAPAAAAVTAQ